MTIRSLRPDLYEVPSGGSENDEDDQFTVRKCAGFLTDTMNYFFSCTVKEDFIRMTLNDANCQFRQYEIQKFSCFRSRLEHSIIQSMCDDQCNEMRVKTLSIISHTDTIVEDLQHCTIDNETAWANFINLKDNIAKPLLTLIESLQLPHLRPYVIEFTDAGPGVACNNYEVKFREVEIAQLHGSALRYRVHLAADDQGQNEAERTNAYIGKYTEVIRKI